MALAALVALAAACASKPAAPPEGRQGGWVRLARTTRVIVERVSHRPTEGGEVTVLVDWMVENAGEAPESFRYGNKVLIDAGGRRYLPSAGEDTPLLAPGERSARLTNVYSLPAAASRARLHWGLYVDGALQYRIALTPPP